MNKLSAKRILQHTMFWISYLAFCVIFYGYYSSAPLVVFKATSLIIPFAMLATYIVIYLLIPQFLLKKKFFLFGLLFFLICLTSIILQRLAVKIIYVDILKEENYSFIKMLKSNTFILIAFEIFLLVAFATAIKLFKTWYVTQNVKIELEKRNVESELALLRNQVNPHFLFNTLNNINSLIYINRDLASETVIKLSEIMRYMLYDSNNHIVLLENEISYISDYIELQKLRIESTDFVQFSIKGKTNGLLIAPMLLIPFVENAFKHSEKNVPSPGIIFNLNILDRILNFEATNYIKTEKSRFDNRGGFGISNIRRRLDLIYKDKYQLDIYEKDLRFYVKFTLNLVDL